MHGTSAKPLSHNTAPPALRGGGAHGVSDPVVGLT
jgi:hypothetical protein